MISIAREREEMANMTIATQNRQRLNADFLVRFGNIKGSKLKNVRPNVIITRDVLFATFSTQRGLTVSIRFRFCAHARDGHIHTPSKTTKKIIITNHGRF